MTPAPFIAGIFAFLVVGFTIFMVVRLFIDSKTFKIKPDAPFIHNHMSEVTGSSEYGRHYKTSKPKQGRVKVEYLGVGPDGGKNNYVYVPLTHIEKTPSSDPINQLPTMNIYPPDARALNSSSRNDGAIVDKISKIKVSKIQEDYAAKIVTTAEQSLERFSGSGLAQAEIDRINAIHKASLDAGEVKPNRNPRKV